MYYVIRTTSVRRSSHLLSMYLRRIAAGFAAAPGRRPFPRRPTPPRRPSTGGTSVSPFSSVVLRTAAGRPGHAGMLPRSAVHLPASSSSHRDDEETDNHHHRASLLRASLLLHNRFPQPFSSAGGAGYLMQTRDLHATARRDMHPLVIGVGAACGLLAVGYAADAVIKWQEKRAALPKESAFGKRFYKGAFEPKMTRREAALILGVRESASRERIREAHRRVLMLNHPDTGGSTLLATKINQAKEMLLGGGETSTTDF